MKKKLIIKKRQFDNLKIRFLKQAWKEHQHQFGQSLAQTAESIKELYSKLHQLKIVFLSPVAGSVRHFEYEQSINPFRYEVERVKVNVLHKARQTPEAKAYSDAFVRHRDSQPLKIMR